jgi:hypothetical protein
MGPVVSALRQLSPGAQGAVAALVMELADSEGIGVGSLVQICVCRRNKAKGEC